MGKAYKRNDRWKRDRRDQGFRKSKKFKEFTHGGHSTQPKPILPDSTVESELTDIDDSSS